MNAQIIPTRLYIKKCSHCELKYYGKHIGKNIETYQGSGTRWNNHLKKHKAKAIHLWNSDWFFDESIIEVAMKFSADNNIVKSENWANIVIENGIQGGNLGKEAHKKAVANRKPTWKDPEWEATVGAEAIAKRKATMSKPEWQATIGADRAAKLSAIMADPEWKATNSAKISAAKNDPLWKESVGNNAASKMAKSQKQRAVERPESFRKGENHPMFGKKLKDVISEEKYVKLKEAHSNTRNNEVYNCFLCPRQIKTNANWQKHLSVTHGLSKEEVREFMCEEVGKVKNPQVQLEKLSTLVP